MIDRAEFMASLPPIMSAVKIGQGETRVQFDIPQSELSEALKLATMHGKRLRVVVAVEDGE